MTYEITCTECSLTETRETIDEIYELQDRHQDATDGEHVFEYEHVD